MTKTNIFTKNAAVFSGASLAKLTTLMAFFFIAFTFSARAATLQVSAGDDETVANGTCSLSEAITNINNGDDAAYPECASTSADPFGTNDTIELPAGTVTLTADLPHITEAVTVVGQGMNESVINGDGAWIGFSTDFDFALHDLTVAAFMQFGFVSAGGNNTVVLERVEIDGTGAEPGADSVLGGIMLLVGDITLNHVYVHDISASGVASVFGISIQAVHGLNTTAEISNTTVANISSSDSAVNGINVSTGIFDGSFTPGSIDTRLTSSTITNIHSESSSAYMLSAMAAVSGGESNVEIEGNNNTISSTSGLAIDAPGSSGGLMITSGAAQPGDNAAATFTGANNIIIGEQQSCRATDDAMSIFGGSSSGTTTNSIISNGGNLAVDQSCSSYFTHTTDQNNVGNLATTLGVLSDNGGFVPTIPLLEGSPAIDAGVTVAGLATDARLETRPQGNAFDSGAYESPYTKVTDQDQSPQENELAKTGGSTIAILGAGSGLLLMSFGVLFRLRKQNQ